MSGHSSHSIRLVSPMRISAWPIRSAHRARDGQAVEFLRAEGGGVEVDGTGGVVDDQVGIDGVVALGNGADGHGGASG